MKYRFNQYILLFSEEIKHSSYSDNGDFGIYFYIEDETYNLHHNKYGMDRLIISPSFYKNYICTNIQFRDLPLNDNTIKFLPNLIKILKEQ